MDALTEILSGDQMPVLVIGHGIVAKLGVRTRAQMVETVQNMYGVGVTGTSLESVLWALMGPERNRWESIDLLRQQEFRYDREFLATLASLVQSCAFVVDFSYYGIAYSALEIVRVPRYLVARSRDLDFVNPARKTVYCPRGLVSQPETLALDVADLGLRKGLFPGLEKSDILLLGLDPKELELFANLASVNFTTPGRKVLIAHEDEGWNPAAVKAAKDYFGVDVQVTPETYATVIERLAEALKPQ